MSKKQMVEWFRQFFDPEDDLTCEARSMASRLRRELGEEIELGYGHPSNWPGEVHLWIGPSHIVIRRCFEEMMFDPYRERPCFRMSCGKSRLESPFMAGLECEIVRLHRLNLLSTKT